MSPLSPLLQLAFILWGRGCLSYWFHLKSRWRYQTRISIPKFSKIISQKNTRSSTFRNANRFNHRHTFLLLWCQSKTLFISDQWSVFKWGDHHEIQQPRTWESLPKLCAHIAHIILLYGLCHIIHMIWRPNYWRINQIFTIWCSSLAHFQTSHNDTTWMFNRMFSNLHFCLLVNFLHLRCIDISFLGFDKSESIRILAIYKVECIKVQK